MFIPAAEYHNTSSPTTPPPLSPPSPPLVAQTSALLLTPVRDYIVDSSDDVLHRQAVAPSPTSVAATLTARTNNDNGLAWYDGASWLAPCSWALALYCVLSFLLLCALYGHGYIDGKLNYIPTTQRLRRARARHARRRGGYQGRIPYFFSRQQPRQQLPDDEFFDGETGDPTTTTTRRTRASTRTQRQLLALEERRAEIEMQLQREVLLQRFLEEQREQQRAVRRMRGEVEEGEDEEVDEERRGRGHGHGRVESLSDRLEAVRVEAALAAAGLL